MPGVGSRGELKRFILGEGDDITRFEYVKGCDNETGEVFWGIYEGYK